MHFVSGNIGTLHKYIWKKTMRVVFFLYLLFESERTTTVEKVSLILLP